MVVMVTMQRDFIGVTSLENKKDVPNTLPSLKFLEQRVHDLVGGPEPLNFSIIQLVIISVGYHH